MEFSADLEIFLGPVRNTSQEWFGMEENQVFGRLGLVVAHPAHILTVFGMVLRYRPKILLLTHAYAGNGFGQANLIQRCFELCGIEDCTTDLEMDEAESYRRAIAYDFGYHENIIASIRDWLDITRPNSVLGDAFELSNYQHDVGRLLLDHALASFPSSGPPIANYEFPLSVQADGDGQELQYGRFLSGEFEEFTLTEEEFHLKQRAVQLASQLDSFVGQVASVFPSLGKECFRPVSPNRDYSVVPTNTARYYDGRGVQEIATGKYKTLITFEKHFCPLVEYLALSPCTANS